MSSRTKAACWLQGQNRLSARRVGWERRLEGGCGAGWLEGEGGGLPCPSGPLTQCHAVEDNASC